MRSRQDLLRDLKSTNLELIVIGGGITGAGIALDAASRGIKVALVEKSDFASGTSSKSTKLIHGGLRYLKQLNFGLVAKTGRERALIHMIAPHLVIPDKMILPFYENGTFGKFTTRLALLAYDTLAGVRGSDRYRILSRAKTLRMIPNLNPDQLKGSGFYAEYRTDDARLTIEIIKKAIDFGAICLNYCKCVDFKYTDDQISGILAKDEESGEEFQVDADVIVNAAGPWVDDVRNRDEEGYTGKKLVLSKGVHLVFDRSRFPLDHTVYFDHGDGRLIFAIPRNNSVYVGTTDTIHAGSPDHLEVTQDDVAYILSGISNKFINLNLTESDVTSTWVGVRPLIYEEGKDVTEISRKDEIFVADSGLITIAGGKLTGYRHMAENIIETFIDSLSGSYSKGKTDKIKLTDNPFMNYEAVIRSIDALEERLDHMFVPDWMPAYLIHNYGKAAFEIIERVPSDDLNLETITVAEIQYTIENEMVRTLLDFYERRTGRMYFQISSILNTIDSVSLAAGKLLGWNKTRIKSEVSNVESAVIARTKFQPSPA